VHENKAERRKYHLFKKGGRKMKKRMFLTIFAVTLVSTLVWQATLTGAAEKQLKMSSVWTAGIQLIEIDRHFVKIVNDLGAGDLKITFFDGGALVPPFELFDAVSRGQIDIGGDWGGYWAGKNEAFNIIGSHPMGLTAVDYMLWVYQGGGYELIQEVYGKYGLVCLPFGAHGSESGVRSKKPIKAINDFKGLKIRIGGKLQGKVLKDLGGVQVMLAGAEVYEALQKGVIDAVEYNIPSVDWVMGLQEVTKYWVSPAWHAPAAIFGAMISKKVWDGLSPRQREILKTAATANFLWSYTFLEYNNIDATKKFLDKGTVITRLNDGDVNKIQEIVNKHTMDSCKENPLFAKVAYSQYKFLNDYSQWRSIAQPFSFGRNPILPDLNAIKGYVK
jgi:TRAP-type mannitol/chloroaromatic compound transport system substrate-binding protein